MLGHFTSNKVSQNVPRTWPHPEGVQVANNRLRSALRSSGYSPQRFAEEVGVDPKTVQRWITTGRTPHRTTAMRAATLLTVSVDWLWPRLDQNHEGNRSTEVIAHYPDRSETAQASLVGSVGGGEGRNRHCRVCQPLLA
ncbi:MAG: helix-turn-helix domain-containing protein [Micromonosporaceae bacterium]